MTEAMSPPLRRATELWRSCDERANFWRTLHFRVRMAVLLLGLLTAVAGALALSFPATEAVARPILNTISILSPLLAALLTALLGMFNMAKKWVAYRAAAETLRSEAFLYAASAEDYSGPDRDAVLAESIRTVEDELTRSTGAKGV
jgi:hypothetical protein